MKTIQRTGAQGPLARASLPLLLFTLLVLAGLPTGAAAQVNVTVGSGTTLGGGTTRIDVTGDLTVNGAFAPDNSTVVFSGTSTQTASGVTTFFGLGVDKGTGTFALSSPTTVERRLDLVSGSLDNTTSGVTLGDGTTIRRTSGSLEAAPTFGATVNVEYAGDQPVTTGNEVPDAGSGTSVETFAVDGTATVTLTKPVTVTKTLALRGGSLDNTANPVTVANTATVEPGGGTVEQTPTYEGPVELVYDGSGALTTGTELPGTVDRITVSAPGGLTLAKDVTVTDVLSVQQGTMDLGGFTVTLDAGATLVEQPGAVVSGETGQIQATQTLTAPSGVNVGGLGFTITSSADLGATTIIRTHARPFNGTDVAAARVYDVQPTNDGGLNATLNVGYDETELTAPDFEAPLELYRSDDGGASWTAVGGTNDIDANAVTLTGVDALSSWTIGAPKDLLPVELARFAGWADADAALLEWTTVSEVNNAGFEVQHRTPEADAFDVLAFVEGAGTTSSQQRYAYRATGLAPGTHTFRLKQVDLDGVTETTESIQVRVEVAREVTLRPNAPNPFRNRTTIAFTVAEDGPAHVDVYNLLGQRVARVFDAPAKAGTVHRVEVDASRFASGVYFYRLHANGEHKTGRMTVVR